MVQRIPWYVEVKKHLVDGQQCLGVILYCAEKKKPLDWSQPAQFSIKLQSFKQNVAAVKRDVKPFIYDHTAMGFGATSFIKWDDLFDASKAYVKNNTIKLKFYVEVADQNEDAKSNLIFTNIEKCCAEGCLVKYRLNVTNIEQLIAVRTPKIVFRNITWRLTVCKTHLGYLAVYIQSFAEDTVSCNITMTVKLVSSKNADKSVENTLPRTW